jgi:hypothetical protein
MVECVVVFTVHSYPFSKLLIRDSIRNVDKMTIWKNSSMNMVLSNKPDNDGIFAPFVWLWKPDNLVNMDIEYIAVNSVNNQVFLNYARAT